MELEKRTHYINLFDVYKNLLTDKQKTYFVEYYLEDYSLKEISDSYNVSRNAIFDQIKKVINILENFEEKLNILNKNTKIKNHIENNTLTNDLLLEIIEE
ncbi:MAG: sigma factor-like helix-turn-helix DNA-binding protein [bacterium]